MKDDEDDETEIEREHLRQPFLYCVFKRSHVIHRIGDEEYVSLRVALKRLISTLPAMKSSVNYTSTRSRAAP